MQFLGQNWKMFLGFLLIGIGGILYFTGYQEIGGIVASAGLSLAGIGVSHKAERAVKALESEAKK